MIPPAPAQKLAELLEDQKVQNPTSSNLVIIITGNFVPMKALQSLRKRYYEGDW
jgi:hypothetical protein